MKIELKNIKIYSAMSEETTAFTADIYVNGEKVGYARNDGRGGCTDYTVYDVKHIPVINDAEKYCEKLPDYTYPDSTLTVKMTLEQFIDNIIDEEYSKKEKQRIARKLQKAMLTAVCVGTDLYYKTHSYTDGKRKTIPLEEIIRKQPAFLKGAIDKIKAGLMEGERILNTNIPAELL
jgi:hypothetical protein